MRRTSPRITSVRSVTRMRRRQFRFFFGLGDDSGAEVDAFSSAVAGAAVCGAGGLDAAVSGVLMADLLLRWAGSRPRVVRVRSWAERQRPFQERYGAGAGGRGGRSPAAPFRARRASR